MSVGPPPPPGSVPGLVTLTLWGVRARTVPAAVGRMALDRRHLHGVPGLRFAKLLGTGSGRTFGPADADPRHWGLLTCWDRPEDAAAFETGPLHRGWARRSTEVLTVRMVPVSSRGRWSRREPFGRPVPRRTTGPVASITRARLRPGRAAGFWRAVPPVSADLGRTPGLLLAVGIGEAPVGLQGTFSLWESADALVGFAHRGAPHRDVVRRTGPERWYAEELFARFAVLSVTGSIGGFRADAVPVLSGPAPRTAGPRGSA